MTPQEIGGKLKERFGDSVLETKEEGPHPFAKVKPESWSDVAGFARDELGCECLHDITAVDSKDRTVLTVVAHLWSFANRHWVNLKADVDRNDPRIASLQPLWKAADWHERECWDMFGVRFEGHPNLRRILCPEDWVGFPLRKDYEMPEEYHGIPGIAVLRGREAEDGRCFPPKKKAAPAAAAKPAATKSAEPPSTGEGGAA